MPECTCDFRAPVHHHATIPGTKGNKYVTRLDYWEDETVFDPACPFHGDNGTMVSRIRLSTTPASSRGRKQ